MAVVASLSGLWRTIAGKEHIPETGAELHNLVARCNAGQPQDVSFYNLRFVLLDTETTGLRPDAGDRIIAVGGVEIVNAKIGGNTFTTLVDPGREIPAKASAITGIRDEHVRGHPAFEEILPRLLEFLAAGVITGYNIQFDLMFINNVLRSKGGPPLNPAVTLDVLSICRALKPGARDYSLEVMAREYAIPVHDRHTALGDALITARLLLCLLPELENRGVRTLRDLNYFLRYRALF